MKSFAGLVPAIDRKVRSRLYYPDKSSGAPCQHDGVPFVVLTVQTEDRLPIAGLVTPVPENARCRVIFFHGNGGCAASNAPLVTQFFRLGAQVIVADYRGYGTNEGHPSEQGLLRDARAFYQYAVTGSRLPVILVGHSLGGNVAIQVAAEKSNSLAGLITVNAVASVAAYAPAYVRPFVTDRYEAVPKARDIRIPWTIAHDIGDELVSLTHGLTLCQANFHNPNMRLITLNNRSHHFVSQSIAPILSDHLAILGQEYWNA